MGQVTGIITDIQHYSVQDGPGTRTTVFFKGCPLRCKWCHNPETFNHHLEVWHNDKICLRCGRCAAVCPEKAISKPSATEPVHVDHSRCKAAEGCHARADVCPPHAMEVVGAEKTATECVEEIAEDRAFYRHGGGGCISGGELTMQAEFAEAIFRGCHDKYISTTMESCCQSSWENIERLLPYVDMCLVDIKHMDPERHREGTGVTNERILENIAKIAATGKSMRVRVPVIPGFNDSEENLAATADFMVANGIKYVDLLPFHNTADSKYRELDREYAYANVEPPTREDMEAHLKIFLDRGLKGTIGGNDIPLDQL